MSFTHLPLLRAHMRALSNGRWGTKSFSRITPFVFCFTALFYVPRAAKKDSSTTRKTMKKQKMTYLSRSVR